jgi:hypothetical protein
MHLATAHAGVMYDTLSVSGTVCLRDGEEGFGVGGLAVPDRYLGILRGRRIVALYRLSAWTHPGAVGGPASRSQQSRSG